MCLIYYVLVFISVAWLVQFLDDFSNIFVYLKQWKEVDLFMFSFIKERFFMSWRKMK